MRKVLSKILEVTDDLSIKRGNFKCEDRISGCEGKGILEVALTASIDGLLRIELLENDAENIDGGGEDDEDVEESTFG